MLPLWLFMTIYDYSCEDIPIRWDCSHCPEPGLRDTLLALTNSKPTKKCIVLLSLQAFINKGLKNV